MATSKFRFRLGSEQHLKLSGKLYGGAYRPDTYNCRLSLRSGSLQASAAGDFTANELERFISSIVDIVKSLHGECVLAPAEVGAFTIKVAVGATGKLVTDVKVTTLTAISTDALGWNTHARFETNWQEYYHPVDLECLNVPSLEGPAGHIPTINRRIER